MLNDKLHKNRLNIRSTHNIWVLWDCLLLELEWAQAQLWACRSQVKSLKKLRYAKVPCLPNSFMRGDLLLWTKWIFLLRFCKYGPNPASFVFFSL